MTGKPGRYLSPEQTVRLGIIQSVDRDKLIEHIVLGLRAQQRKNDRRVSGLRGKR
jgi:hypothetical protein